MNESLFHPVTLKNISIPGNIFLAPLAGYTDPAFREICIMHGASFTYTEMVSVEALARSSKKTETLMKRAREEELFGIQIFLSNAQSIKHALGLILEANPTVIDINCGCPVPKIVKTGAGASLMKNPVEINRIVKTITDNTKIPVTIKIRSGWDNTSINYLECADAAVQGGASLISMHPRTRSQGYSGKVSLEYLSRLKAAVSVPVFGSGNLFSPKDAQRMLNETGIDGILFARGAIGNPFIFEQTRKLLQYSDPGSSPSLKEIISTALLHLQKSINYKGERIACKEMRKHIGSYTKGLPGAAALRREAVKALTFQDYKDLFENYRHTFV